MDSSFSFSITGAIKFGYNEILNFLDNSENIKSNSFLYSGPKFSIDVIPIRSIGRFLSLIFKIILDKFSFENLGGIPLNMSLAPKEIATAFMSSVILQSVLDNPPAVVSPDTPALIKEI